MKNISVEDLKKNVNNYLIVDVRSPQEHQDYSIENSLLVPLDQLQEKISQTVPDLETKFVVYCKTGGRSMIAAQILEQMGYKNVFNLEGGIVAWNNN